MIQKLFIITLFAILTGCHSFPNMLKPKPPGLQDAPRDAPHSYQQGWADGCESGLAAYGNLTYKAFYKFRYDPVLIRDQMYLKAWKDRYAHCRAMANRTLRDGLSMTTKGTSHGIFQAGGYRDEPDVEKGYSILPKIFRGVNTPGYGSTSWGASASHGIENFLFGSH